MNEKEALKRVKTGNFNSGRGFDMQLLVDAVGTIGEMLKSGQISEVVRCKDCIEYKECGTGKICMKLGSYYRELEPDDFCSLGIRR